MLLHLCSSRVWSLTRRVQLGHPREQYGPNLPKEPPQNADRFTVAVAQRGERSKCLCHAARATRLGALESCRCRHVSPSLSVITTLTKVARCTLVSRRREVTTVVTSYRRRGLGRSRRRVDQVVKPHVTVHERLCALATLRASVWFEFENFDASAAPITAC
jgi:hypothetical protein